MQGIHWRSPLTSETSNQVLWLHGYAKEIVTLRASVFSSTPASAANPAATLRQASSRDGDMLSQYIPLPATMNIKFLLPLGLVVPDSHLQSSTLQFEITLKLLIITLQSVVKASLFSST